MRTRLFRRPRYELPNVLTSTEDLARFYHSDLRGMADEELLAEDIAAKSAFAAYLGTRVRIPIPGGANSVRASDWLLQRMREIRAEGDKRRGSAR